MKLRFFTISFLWWLCTRNKCVRYSKSIKNIWLHQQPKIPRDNQNARGLNNQHLLIHSILGLIVTLNGKEVVINCKSILNYLCLILSLLFHFWLHCPSRRTSQPKAFEHNLHLKIYIIKIVFEYVFWMKFCEWFFFKENELFSYHTT